MGSINKIAQLLLICVCVVFTQNIFAQKLNYYYPDANKNLPQSFIYDIQVDTSGQLWLATGEDVALFNGTVISSPYKPDSIFSNFSTALTIQGNFSVVGYIDGEIRTYRNDSLLQSIFTELGSIVAIKQYANNIYVAGQQGVAQFSIENNSITNIISTEKRTYLTDFVLLEKSILYTSNKGLHRVAFNSKKSELISEGKYFKITATPAGDCLAFSKTHAYSIFKAQNYSYPKSVEISELNQILTKKNNFYLATDIGLLKLTLADTKTTFSLSGSYSIKNGLVNNNILSFYLNGGNLWICNSGEGLTYINTQNQFIWHNNSVNLGTCVSVENIGDKIFSCHKNGINEYSANPLKLLQTHYLPHEKITAAENLNSTLLIGTESGKLFSFLNGDFTEKRICKISRNKKEILSISSTNKNTILIAQRYFGVYQTNAKLNRVKNQWTTKNGLLHNDVYKNLKTSNNSTWFVTKGSGLAILLANNTFKYLSIKDGFTNLDFTDLVEDAEQNIWLTSLGGGISKVTKDFVITNFPSSTGISSDFIYGITKNETGRLFFYSKNSFNELFENAINTYSSKQISHNVNFDERAILSLNNQIYIGSDKGLIIHTKSESQLFTPPKLTIKSVLFNDADYVTDNTTFTYSDHKIIFTPSVNKLNPSSPSKLEYRLSGFDKEWLPFESDKVVYQSVKNGSYTFELRDSWNPANKTQFSFIVNKPFWAEPGFYILLIVLGAAIFFLILKIRTKQLIRQNHLLEKLVQERTHYIEEKSKSLEQFAYAMSHDLKNPSVNLIELIKILDEDEELSLENKEVVNHLQNAAAKMHQNLIDFLHVLRSVSQNSQIKETVSIKGICSEVVDSIQQIANNNNAKITLNIKCDKIKYHKQSIHSVLYNLITNAIKYRQEDIDPIIDIKAYKVGKDNVVIEVKDNGLGIDLIQNGAKLFTMFQRFHSHVEGTGVGLSLVKNIVEKNGGSVKVNSKVGEGTTFIVSLGAAVA